MLVTERQSSSGATGDVICYIVELRGHDEVVLVQPFDLLRLEGHRRIALAEADIRVMTLRLSHLSRLPHKGEGFSKVLECVGPFDPPRLILDGPIRHLLAEHLNFIARERRDAAATGRAGLCNEGCNSHDLLP